MKVYRFTDDRWELLNVFEVEVNYNSIKSTLDGFSFVINMLNNVCLVVPTEEKIYIFWRKEDVK